MTGRANRNTSQAVGNAAHCLGEALFKASSEQLPAEPGAWITPQVAQNLDRQYRDGFTAGWNAGVAGDDELLAAVQNRVGKREDYEAASAPVSAELQLRIDQVAMVVQTLANDIRKYNRRNEPK